MDDAKFKEQLLKRLAVLVRLQVERPPPHKPASITRIVQRLMAYGLSPSEIAPIIGKPLNYVTAIVSGKKKAKRKRNE